MKKLKSENPCSMGILTRGGGQDALAGACGVGTRLCDKQASTTMPPLRLERECKEHSAEQNDLLSFCERRNSATITAIMGLRAHGRRIAFTMAEILLSLTIIGVVAAITLPSLTGNINERTWNTQRKALYARFSQALALMPSLNGYGTLSAGSGTSGTDSYIEPEDSAAETFITSGLSKVMKINNICDSEHLEDCGIPETITTYDGNVSISDIKTITDYNDKFVSQYKYTTLNTKAAAFETQNGESILVYYNPSCAPDMGETAFHYTAPKMCANFIYDLNGSKGPNTVGKDIGFITALYPTDPVVVAPMPLAQDTANGKVVSYDNAGAACQQQDPESRVPNREELTSLFYNKKLLGMNAQQYMSSSKDSADKSWRLHIGLGGYRYPAEDTISNYVRCIKR